MSMKIKTMGCVVGLAAAGLAGTAQGAAGTVLLVVINSGSLTAQETARKTLIQGWGYTVTAISASASQGTFDTSCRSASCAYISCTVTGSTLAAKLLNQTIPVVCELDAQGDDLGFASATTNFTAKSIDITNTTHYITSAFSSGSLQIFASNQSLRYLSGTVGSYTTLAEKLASSSACLVVFERNGTMYGGSTYTAGRRVFLPGSGSSVDITDLTTNGETLIQRSIEWCLMPLSYWTLDDGSGTTVVDSNDGHNGTLNGPSWQTGKLSKCLKFDGSNDYVQIANHADFQVTAALTVAAWVKGVGAWPTGSTAGVVLRKGDDNPNNWELCIGDGKVELNLDCGDADGAGCDGSTTLSLNAWHHVAGTWDGTTAKVYLDGALNGSKAKAAPIGTDTRVIYIGGRTGSTDVFPGYVDDVRFYNRALTAAEIAAMASISPTVTSWENAKP